MTFYFGSHNKVADGLINAAKEIKEAQGNFMQIFLSIPTTQEALNKEKDNLLAFKKFLIDNDMKVVVHSNYTHNLARSWDKYSWWLTNIEIEIEYAHLIGAIGVVIHFGKALDLSIEEAYNNMYSSLIYIHNKTSMYKDVRIILETSTGQGSEICYKLEDLTHFYRKFIKNHNKELRDRIRLCIDSCHIFSAGYNLKTKTAVRLYVEAFEEMIGLRYIYLIHLNDCKVDVGCQKDRHENIGEGYIGLKGLQYFFKFFRKLNVPIVLETPGDGFKKEIPMLLKSLTT